MKRRWFRWKWWRKLVGRAPLLVPGATAVLCMALALMHALAHSAASGSDLQSWQPKSILAGILLAVGVALWVIWKCESGWLRESGLDLRGYRKFGWTQSRSVILLLSMVMTALAFRHARIQHATALDLQLLIAIGGGYAMWCVTALSLLWSLVPKRGGGGLQGAPVPVAPLLPNLRRRLSLNVGDLVPA